MHTAVTIDICGWSRSVAFTTSITRAGRGSKRAAVLAVWRASAVSAAARTPLPVTSPSTTIHDPSTSNTS